MKSTIELTEERFILVGRSLKNYSTYKVTLNEQSINVTGKNTAKLVGKCLEAGMPYNMIVFNSKSYKELKWEYEFYLKYKS
tara:strand:+ start:68 stop:310 length:243 start_codon:yes stop_codon:yes gene_type:complete